MKRRACISRRVRESRCIRKLLLAGKLTSHARLALNWSSDTGIASGETEPWVWKNRSAIASSMGFSGIARAVWGVMRTSLPGIWIACRGIEEAFEGHTGALALAASSSAKWWNRFAISY